MALHLSWGPLGLAISDLRRDYAAPVHAALADVDARRLEAVFGELERAARTDLGCRARRSFSTATWSAT